MTPRQRIELAQSKRRQRLGELLTIEERSDDETAELARITDVEMPQGEVELRAAIAADDDPAPAAGGITEPVAGIDPKRVELRNASSLAAFVSAAITGRPLAGAEAELAAEVNLGTGFVPLEIFTPPSKPAGAVETRAVSGAPDNVGVNLAPILPSIFARAVAGRLGIEMPRVPTGTYATGTITVDLTAEAKNKNDAAAARAATITTATTTPHRISARLAIALEDIAAVGTDNFEASLRQNLSLVLSAKLDEYALRGTGVDAVPRGLMPALTAPAAAPAAVVDWLGFVKAVTGGIDGGPWAEDMSAVRLCVNAATMQLAAETFREPVGTEAEGYATPGEMSAAAYLKAHAGGFFASSRMPDTAANNVAQCVRYRPATMGLEAVEAVRTAVCPVWSEIGIDDIHTESASGVRNVTFHVLVGDVIVTQADAYERVDLKLA